MVFVPDETEEDDPPNRGKSAGTGDSGGFEAELGELVVKHLQQTPRVTVTYTGDSVEVEPLKRESERPVSLPPPPQRGIEQTEKNRQTASNSSTGGQPSNRQGTLSTQGHRGSQQSNGISNVRSLTEKQAKAHLLLEQTDGEISTGDLAEKAGYSSKSGAHSARQNWEEESGLVGAE